MQVAYIGLPLLVFIISVFLAGLVLKSAWRSPIHQLFSAFLVAMALWGLTIFGMRSSPNLDVAYRWEQWVFIVIPFVSIFFCHFSIRFTKDRASPWILYLFYASGAVVAFLSLADMVATGMQTKFYGYAPVLGPAFPFYVVATYMPTLLAISVLLRAHRRSQSADEKTRLGYIILGAVASLLGATTDALPPLGLHIYPLGILSNIVFGVLATIAIVRYRLLELRLLLRRGFAYSLVSSGIFAVYGLIFFLFSTIFTAQTNTAAILSTVAALLVVAIALPPLVDRAQQFVDRLFFRERYDHLQALERFTVETRDITDFPTLASSLVKTVSLAMQAHWVSILLPDQESGDFQAVEISADTEVPPLVVRQHSSLARWLARNERGLRIQEFELDPYLQAMGDAERQALRSSGAELFVPMKSKGELTGILVLGPRLLENDYAGTDIELLTTVTSQGATMIENARLYSQEMARLRELEQLDNLKSTLLQTVSHELKSPVTAIKTAVDLLSNSDGTLGERIRARLMRALQSGVDRMERLIQESLDYAAMQSSQLELHQSPTDMAKLVEEVVGLVGPSVNSRRQEVTVDVPEDLPPLLVDAPRIERILLNLLSNASKFTPPHGRITISLRREDSQIVTEVSDSGPGISEEDQPFVFNEYYRGNKGDETRDAGTGLGLSIAKYLVEMHGGTIGVRSNGQDGSTFTVTLPFIPALEHELDRSAPTP